MLMIAALYLTILVGSLTRVWGVDYSLDWRHYETALRRGLEAFMDTTFLATVATPIAGVTGMVIAYLVVRKAFSGKAALDFMSNLGGAVPGTILGIGYILAFIEAPLILVGVVYLLLASYLAAAGVARVWAQWCLVLLGSLLGHGLLLTLSWSTHVDETPAVLYGLLLLGMAGLGTVGTVSTAPRRLLCVLGGMGCYVLAGTQISYLTESLAEWGRGLEGALLPKIVTNLAEQIEVCFRPPPAILGLTAAVLSVSALSALRNAWRPVYAVALLAVSYALVFDQPPLVLVGTPYIIIAAYAVRSLPASVRAGVAALQQIDPAIEEASANLGADSAHTFRRVTLPLILPAFIAGLIFSFARHVTSLSAIIFLTTPRWRILTALVLSEVEQGGMSVAAAYSVLLIVLVLGAIGVMYAVAGWTLQAEGRVDMALGAG
jgi:iron(III) transport system permease protein